MNKSRTFLSSTAALLVGASAVSLSAQTVLDASHADINFGYADATWNLTVRDVPNNTLIAPGSAVLSLNSSTAKTVPSGAAYSFLGAAGSTYYAAPQTQAAGQLFLGLSSQTIGVDTFEGNDMNVFLRSFSGPGNFALFSVNAGTPTVHFNSADGLSSADTYDLHILSDDHFNWAFSAPGTYTLGLEVTGFDLGQGQITSPVTTFTFQVVPEPTTYALLGAGSLCLLGLRKRK